LRRICDFHIHSLYSDGDLLPSEIARRTHVLGHKAIAITDHVDESNLEYVVEKLVKAADHLEKLIDDMLIIPGVELTHVPPQAIHELADKAKKLGAKIVVVHGETVAEPVAPGTNKAALTSSSVDLLAHPGLLSEEDCDLAKENDIYLELTARVGHCLTNGLVAKLAMEKGIKLLVCSDAHTVGDFLNESLAMSIALGAGLSRDHAEQVVYKNPEVFLSKLTR